ncbi:hypothetical protein [Altericista sp. CCNU0014]|uniref:hypothetical protein n=1 Tax=Altericista sp. CCNU0014 TaxID=3082949 RepID=UPI00385050C6
MNGLPMQQFNEGDERALHALMPLKIKEIQKKRGTGAKVYCETNHSYIKGWGYLLPDFYIPQSEIGVIILSRAADDTAASLLRVHEVPGISEWSRTWYLKPGDVRNQSAPAENANPYELCQWYVEEINLRAEDYKRRFPGITYFECTLDRLNHESHVAELFATFGLEPSAELKSAIGQPLNTRSEWPKLPMEDLLAVSPYPNADRLSPAERDALVERMVAYLHESRASNIAAMEPDKAMGGSLGPAAVAIVARAEGELEKVFQYSLKFTETERILIDEFLRSTHPLDLFFVVSDRTGGPGISYTYNFNVVLSVQLMIRQLGPSGAFKALWMMVKGLWGRDYSHRNR